MSGKITRNLILTDFFFPAGRNCINLNVQDFTSLYLHKTFLLRFMCATDVSSMII